MGLKYSANVGFLWEHLTLPERIEAAAKGGFDAVECHFPYEHDAKEIASALKANNLSMVGINTLLGPPDAGLFGVAGLEGKETLAKSYIDQAIDYASEIGASNVNVVAGAGPNSSKDVYVENLRYASERARQAGKTILIEALNPRAVPEYLFSRIDEAASIIDQVGEDNVKIMFDFFHTQIVQGDLVTLLEKYLQYIGHIQISAVHDRGEPDEGEVNYPYVLGYLHKNGYSGYIGAEYKPRGATVEEGLGWLTQFRKDPLLCPT